MTGSMLSIQAIFCLVLASTATAQSHYLNTLPRCWQTCATTKSPGPQCSDSDLNCLCHFASSSLLSGFTSCLQQTCASSRELTEPLQSLQDVCRNTFFGVSDATVQRLSEAADILTPADAKQEQVPQLELRTVRLREAIATTTPASMTTSTVPTQIMMASGKPVQIAGTDDSASYSMPAAITVTTTATAKAHAPSGMASGQAGSGGTLLDMSDATSNRRSASLMGLMVCVLACIAWF